MGNGAGYTFFGAPVSNGISSVEIEGPGTVVFDQVNTYTGDTALLNTTGGGFGTLQIGPGGSIAASDELQLYGNSTFDISLAGDQTIQNLTAGTTAAGSTIDLGANTLTVELTPGAGAKRRHHFRGQHQGDRRPDQGGPRDAYPDGRQHLWRRHDDR